jgi:branched-chain amino acid transport system permease protein
VVAGLCGLIVGPTALRLRGLYLAIVTIGIVFIGQHLFQNVDRIAQNVSGGPGGTAIPSVQIGAGVQCQPSCSIDSAQGFSIGGTTIDHNGVYYYVALIILVLAMVFVRNLVRTRMGRALQAVREREVAASLMGINLVRTKLAAFVISSFLAGVGGALYGSYLGFVRPQSWDLILSISFVAMIIVGGIGTVWGALLGAIVVAGTPTVLNNYADSIPFLQHGASGGGLSITEFSSIFYGGLIILFLVLEPRGVVGLFARLAGLAQRLARPAALPPATPLPSQQSA